MCGRYAATANPDELVEEFEIDENRTAEPARSMLSNSQNPPPAAPDYNMAPTKQAPVVLARAPKEAAGVANVAESAGSAGSAEASAAPKGARPDSPADRAADQQAGPPEGALPVRQLRLLTWGLVPAWAKDPK